jgi:hypothetical protein
VKKMRQISSNERCPEKMREMSSSHLLQELTIEKGWRERGSEGGRGRGGRGVEGAGGQRERRGWEGGREREREKRERVYVCVRE